MASTVGQLEEMARAPGARARDGDGGDAMIETKYTCDRCGSSTDAETGTPFHRGEMREIELRMRTLGAQQSFTPMRIVEWCDRCVRLTGLVSIYEKLRAQLEAQGMAVPEPLTLDQLVRDIVREEIDDA
jgi:hypothetical protein